MHRVIHSISIKEIPQFITEKILFSPSTIQAKESMAKNIVEQAIDTANKQISFWQFSHKPSKLFEKIVDYYTTTLLQLTFKNHPAPVYDYEVAVMNKNINELLTNDNNLKFLTTLANQNIESVVEKYLYGSFEIKSAKAKEESDYWEHYEDQLKMSIGGLVF